MKKLITLFITMMFFTSAMFAQIDDAEFFVFKYKPGESSPTTTLALGSANNKHNIQYKLTTDADWTDSGIAGATKDETLEIETASTSNDEYIIRYRMHNQTDKAARLTLNFKDYAGNLLDIVQWGTKTMDVQFETNPANATADQRYTQLIDISATDVVKFNKLSFRWNSVFSGAATDMSNWDVSSITGMANMFQSATSFNGDISSWNVSNVTGMANMFNGATSFNGDISTWNVSKVASFQSMFNGATLFNQDISGWNTGGANNMGNMFQSADAFNQDISGWNVSNVTNFTSMFNKATNFNQDLSGWDVSSNAITMNSMFQEAEAFNQDISGWDVSNVTTMANMFNKATNFNGDISSWNVSKVTSFQAMFQGATAFDQDLSKWTPTAATTMVNMFNQGGLSTKNYTALLIGWWAKEDDLPSGITFSAGTTKYGPAASDAREKLGNDEDHGVKKWIITDGGLDPDFQTAVSNQFENSTIRVAGSTIYFSELPQSNVSVYNIAGGMEASYSPAYSIDINLNTGVYIIRYDNNYQKILIK